MVLLLFGCGNTKYSFMVLPSTAPVYRLLQSGICSFSLLSKEKKESPFNVPGDIWALCNEFINHKIISLSPYKEHRFSYPFAYP